LKLRIVSGLICFLWIGVEGMTRVPTVNIERYRKLVAMEAWKAWRKLPMQTRMWIGIEDLIEDGMKEVWKLTKTYNPDYASFTTAVYHRTHRYFINEYLEFHSAQKRGWTRIKEGDGYKKTNKRFGHKRAFEFQSMEALTAKTKDNMTYDEAGVYPALTVSPETITQNAVTECFVVPALVAVYRAATSQLQDSMYEWFLTTKPSRIHLTGKPFKKASCEFRKLCKCENITCSDCVHLVRSQSCLDSFHRSLFGVCRDLDYPTPAVEKML
jgi:hypothetical protein